jgi:hypothetical protein
MERLERKYLGHERGPYSGWQRHDLDAFRAPLVTAARFESIRDLSLVYEKESTAAAGGAGADNRRDREALGVSRTTVFFWVGDMPRPKRCLERRAPGHAVGNKAMQAKYRRLRQAAYEEGTASFESMQREDGFSEFVTLFMLRVTSETGTLFLWPIRIRP